jgi:hypothetical protein
MRRGGSVAARRREQKGKILSLMLIGSKYKLANRLLLDL